MTEDNGIRIWNETYDYVPILFFRVTSSDTGLESAPR